MMKIAVAGATGAVGRQMLVELEDSTLKGFELHLFASPSSDGMMLNFRGKPHRVSGWDIAKASDCDVVLMSAGGGFSRENSPVLAQNGVMVIDNSSAFRRHDDIPLVVPEVNGHLVEGVKPGIIANPNCSTIQMVVPLHYFNEKFGVNFVQVATYQSVSGSGQKGIEELARQVKAQLNFKEPEVKVYPQKIAFNVLSAIGDIDDAGHAEEEEKMVIETKKILGKEDIEVLATTARVPVTSCHSEAVTVGLDREVSREELIECLRDQPGVVLVEGGDQSELPSCDLVADKREVYVSRVRVSHGRAKSKWMQFWNVADNLKKGAATNAVQILELALDKM